jgi:hypothetical protein
VYLVNHRKLPINLPIGVQLQKEHSLSSSGISAPHAAHSVMFSFSLRWPLATRDPHPKRSKGGKGSVAASLAFLPLVVHNLALTWIGSALVQVAISSYSDERETSAATRAPHIRREQVKPHGKLWHRSLLRRGLLAACRATHSTEVAGVASWDVEDLGTYATGSALEIRA